MHERMLDKQIISTENEIKTFFESYFKHKFLIFFFLFCVFFSCTKPEEKKLRTSDTETGIIQNILQPIAKIQAGEYPLWFQVTKNGPELLETIENACFSAALIPWPIAPHIRYILALDDSITFAVNCEGFIHFSLDKSERIDMFRISGGEFWQQYTVGAFFAYEKQPVALLFLDDIFIDSDSLPPSPRLWTYTLYSSFPESVDIPVMNLFPAEEGWNIDMFQYKGDGFWYYRAKNKNNAPPIQWRRFDSFNNAEINLNGGEKITIGVFRNVDIPEPLSAAPAPLQELLKELETSNCGIASVICAKFPNVRNFSISENKNAFAAFYSEKTDASFLLAADPMGKAFFCKTENGSAPSVYEFNLPVLPDAFIYTGICLINDTIIAAWEEQEGYSIGAAGFMVIRK